MIAVPWFKFPWSSATADLAHALALAALDGDTEAKGQLDEIEAQARRGNKSAVEAWRYFSAIIRLAVAGEPPPSVILQMQRRAVVGKHHGHHGGGFGYPGGVPWGYGFSEPFFMEEMMASIQERAFEEGEQAAREKGGSK